MVEFIIVFMPLFTFFLCIFQMGLLYTASLGVQRAAHKAARAAAVVFPDDPKKYENSMPNQISTYGCEDDESSKLTAILGALSDGDMEEKSNCKGGPRVSAIRTAAILSMLPFSSRLDRIIPAFSFGSSTVVGLASSFAYSMTLTAVNFPVERGSQTLKQPGDFIDSDKDVTVRVTHAFHCQIPVAKNIICSSWRDRMINRIQFNSDDPSNEILALNELDAGVSMPRLADLALVSRERFFLLRKDASFPMQGAGYDYQ